MADFDGVIKTVRNETTDTEVGNIKMKIDSTRLGTVISLYKDI